MPILCPGNAAKLAYCGIKEIYERAKVLSENDELRKSIERRAGDLKQVADELNASEVENFPPSCLSRLQDFEDSIHACTRICAELKDRPLLGRMAGVHDNRRRLENLDKQLEKAQQSLHFALTRVIHAQNRELKECVEKGHERAEATTIHPSIGVYPGAAGKGGRRPSEIPAPNVAVIDDLLVIKWTDSFNSAKDIDRYEVRYNDENEMVLGCEPAGHRVDQEDTFALSLGHPKVCPGRLYTISVRAVIDSQGPGNWSDPTVARFKKGPPNKPKKPTLIVLSPTEVQVQAPRLDEKNENGSPVHQCIVEYLDTNDGNATAWNHLMCNVRPPALASNKDIVKFSIKHLTPDTTYLFRVRMVNEAGKSAPSDSKEVLTTQLIPGPPRELCASSKRLSKYIKLRWKEPRQNPQAVFKYQVQMQLAKSKETPWFDVTTVGREKLSAKPTDLSTGTEYRFRVRALNDKQQQGEFSEVLEAETRCGAAAKVAATTGAFFGGTIGGPLLGAVGFGIMAGSAAKDSADSKAGKAAAATAAGIGAGVGGALFGTIGAPVMGVSAAYLAYRRLDRGPDQWSPQTSDDENEEEGFMESVMKITEKKTESMFNIEKKT